MARTKITQLPGSGKLDPVDLLTAVSASATAPFSTKITVKTLSDSLTTVSSSISAATASSADNFTVRNTLYGTDAYFTGTINANTLKVSIVSSSVIYSSGSNIFGDESTDTHQFTGSVLIRDSVVIPTFASNPVSAQVGQLYYNTTDTNIYRYTSTGWQSGAGGSSGTSGQSGVGGSSGTSGQTGGSGSSGTSGQTGGNGSSGTSGANGSSGTSGQTGGSGSSGTSGQSGPTLTENTWTPGFAATLASFSYASQVGYYVKIGNVVTATFRIELNTSGNSLNGNNLVINTLPFNAKNTSNLITICSDIRWTNLTTSMISLIGTVDPNSTFINLFKITAAATSATTSMIATDLHATNGSVIEGTITYISQ